MRLDRGVLWAIVIACAIIVAWLVLDHVLFPTLPVPAGVPPIAK